MSSSIHRSRRPRTGAQFSATPTLRSSKRLVPLRPLRPIVRGERGPVHPCSESLLAALRFLYKHSLALPVSFHK